MQINQFFSFSLIKTKNSKNNEPDQKKKIMGINHFFLLTKLTKDYINLKN